MLDVHTSLPFRSPVYHSQSVSMCAHWRNSTLQCKHLAHLWVCPCQYRYGQSTAALWLIRRLHIVRAILSTSRRLLLSAAKHERISLMPSSFPHMPTALLYVECLPSCPPLLAWHIATCSSPKRSCLCLFAPVRNVTPVPKNII